MSYYNCQRKTDEQDYIHHLNGPRRELLLCLRVFIINKALVPILIFLDWHLFNVQMTVTKNYNGNSGK